ncbi:PREDICTED: putative E3 ubiquitin-protein ligase LIN-2 [Fragaria vesca subsp. vesca]|uniref:putative E3 ubiquitin-protein ligase LIN-2 n=1 Tax=Fragaria vesca subsp. vesca TaxID=101020 RepID=UPI0002C31EB9|nr:PREDICTED: putative E3 ubiquitin-protein ligase LIN-2 [Fragaria vesca subsp. vesca]
MAASSLRELLTEEAYHRGNNNKVVAKTKKPVKYRVAPDESLALLPIHICHDRKSYDFSKHKAQSSVLRKGSSRRVSSTSERSHTKTVVSEGSSRRTEPAAIDEVATKAVVSILSGYAGRYVKDEEFREEIEEKCRACLARKKRDSDNGVLETLESGVENVNKLVLNPVFSTKAMRKCIENLSRVVASLDANKSKMNASTCGIPNSNLSACAQLYLAIVHKIERNDLVSAKHLLQVFCDSPSLARTHLLPDLWEHLFLPHLLHLKIWYSQEIEVVSHSFEKEKRMKSITKVYNDQMDLGTTKFAQYYKEWLKVGSEAPPVAPEVPLPLVPFSRSRRRRASDSSASHSSLNKNLYQAVFGSTLERRSVGLDDRHGVSNASWDVDEQEKLYEDEAKADNYNSLSCVHREDSTIRKSLSQNHRNPKPELWPESDQTKKSDYFGFFSCQNAPTECLVNRNLIVKSNSVQQEDTSHLPSSNLGSAISILYSSDSLSDCESAVRAITKAWLDSHGDPVIEAILSEPPLIQGMLEVLFASSNDEILELVISVLAEFVARNDQNTKIILNFDPQLEIFMRLLRSSGLFLKAAVLLYLLKPKAKQMKSLEWVALVLRVLEFGDQLQTLFTVRCSPQAAALYLLDQLLTGFDEDRNLENARQVVSLGGLSLLVKQIEKGDTHERNSVASIISCCVRADGNCRNYLADFLDKPSLLELIVLGNGSNSTCSAFALLIEILCLSRRTKITKILDGLKEGCCGLNTMQILLVYLQRASAEERPLVAAILLQLDLMGDPYRCSVYREEAIEAMIGALDCQTCDVKVQERSARSLLMLGGWFSYTGEASTEHWLLQQAGFSYSSRDSFHFREGFLHSNEDEEATENWQRKAAIVLFRSGNKKLLVALSDSIANGIPSLARVSLVTLSWMSSYLSTVGNEHLKSMACSILVPQLLESLKFHKDVEERVLASYSLLNLVKSSGDEYIPMLSSVDREVLSKLQNLSLVTWTANELISIITSNYED